MDRSKKEEIFNRREFFKKTAWGMLPILAFSVFGNSLLVSCDKGSDVDGDEDWGIPGGTGGTGASGNSIPDFLPVGTEILFTPVAEFGFFRVIGEGKGQWNDVKAEQISQMFSLATFTYTKTGKKETVLKSVNTQASTSRTWTIRVEMSFGSANGGTFRMSVTNPVGKTTERSGEFKATIPTTTGGSTCKQCSSGCSSSCSDNCSGSCSKSCADTCAQNCKTTCRGECVYTCIGSCKGVAKYS